MLEGADFQDGSPVLEPDCCLAPWRNTPAGPELRGPSLRKGGCLLCTPPPVSQSFRLPLFGRERERSRGPGAGENPGANRDLPTTLFLKNHGRLEWIFFNGETSPKLSDERMSYYLLKFLKASEYLKAALHLLHRKELSLPAAPWGARTFSITKVTTITSLALYPVCFF